jgi:hypothetical protein
LSLIIRSATGDEGQIELVGVRAVVGIFLRWNLERHGEDRSGNPSWTLRAVLSYQKDSILRNDSMTKKVKIHFPRGAWYEVVPEDGCIPTLEQERFVIENARLKIVGGS